MKISAKNDLRNSFWDILDDFGKIGIFAPQIGPKWLITAKNGNYGQKMKNHSKICIFRFLRLKLGLNDEKLNYLSDPAYKKLISQKTKKLARFFDSQAPPPLTFCI